ncbi:MAG: urate hydroxylase PuuD, partial [Flavobacteriales bacterium]|nr:urate hydroxylase PuuD [Flavobacteriales bacterium]
MEATILEWLNLLARWVHVIAAIMWIGDSFLFMWMDSHLSQPRSPRTGTVVGELWMVHSGGFYEVVKRKSLSQAELPPNLYWFKWESYTTWISGFLLLIIVYYAGGSIYLVDPAVLAMSQAQAVGTSLGLLLVGWLVYDAVWSTVGQSNVLVAKVISLLLLVAAVFAVTHVF